MKYSFYRCLIACILLSQISCAYFKELRAHRNKAEADLDAICKNIPIPSDFVEADSEKSLDIEKVAIFKNYRSYSTCDVVGEHFRNYFIEKGWNREQIKVRQSRGGMETLDFDFRDGEYLISVACQNDVKDEARKQIGLSCSWGLR